MTTPKPERPDLYAFSKSDLIEYARSLEARVAELEADAQGAWQVAHSNQERLREAERLLREVLQHHNEGCGFTGAPGYCLMGPEPTEIARATAFLGPESPRRTFDRASPGGDRGGPSTS